MHHALRSYYYSQRGRAYSEELTAWKSAVEGAGHTAPSATVLSALDTFLATSLESGTILSRMKTGNIKHAGSKGAVLFNLKDPDAYKLTEIGTVIFSEGNGCKSDGASYFNQGYPANAYAGIESNVTFINYVSESSTTTETAKAISGFRVHSTTAAYVALRPKAGVSNLQAFNYSTTPSSPVSSSSNHKGLYILTRSGGNIIVYKDGVKSSVAVAAVAPNTAIKRFILAYNGATTEGGSTPAEYYTYYVACDFIFDAFSDTDSANFKTAFDTYKTATSLP